MPANNSIPMVVAAARGLFNAQGIRVSLILFNGQLERETALQTGVRCAYFNTVNRGSVSVKRCRSPGVT